MAQEVRKYLDDIDFIEVETPVLIKSTPKVRAILWCQAA
jgi:aspartyl-tRNA synthetase